MVVLQEELYLAIVKNDVAKVNELHVFNPPCTAHSSPAYARQEAYTSDGLAPDWCLSPHTIGQQ
jgi:hypothetical protein